MREAAKSYPFWCITTGHLGLGTALFMVNTHAVAHFVSLGLDKLLAAFVFGLIGFIRIGGTLIWGYVSDQIGRNHTYSIATTVAIVGLAMVTFLPNAPAMWMVYAAAILYSIGHSAGNPTYGAVIADIFSGPQVGLIFGFLEVSFGIGSAIGAWVGGYLFDLTGNYRWSFSLCLICFAISGLSIRACSRWQERQAAA